MSGDATPGEMTIDRKADSTDIDINSQGRTLKAHVRDSMFTLSPAGPTVVTASGATDVKVLVRRVDATHVRMLAASCD